MSQAYPIIGQAQTAEYEVGKQVRVLLNDRVWRCVSRSIQGLGWVAVYHQVWLTVREYARTAVYEQAEEDIDEDHRDR